MAEPVLRVEGLCLKRDGRQILRDVNLSVYPGRVHALLGLNGSGKSFLASQEPARFEGIPVGKYIRLSLGRADRERAVAALGAVALPGKIYGYRGAARRHRQADPSHGA